MCELDRARASSRRCRSRISRSISWSSRSCWLDALGRRGGHAKHARPRETPTRGSTMLRRCYDCIGLTSQVDLEDRWHIFNGKSCARFTSFTCDVGERCYTNAYTSGTLHHSVTCECSWLILQCARPGSLHSTEPLSGPSVGTTSAPPLCTDAYPSVTRHHHMHTSCKLS